AVVGGGQPGGGGGVGGGGPPPGAGAGGNKDPRRRAAPDDGPGRLGGSSPPMSDAAAAAISWNASAGRMNPRAASAIVSNAHRATNRACKGHRAASFGALNGRGVPNRKQTDVPAGPRPDRVAAGTSTAGVRTPPSTLPLASSTNDGGVLPVFTRSLAACGGACPVRAQRFSQ